MYIRKRMLYHQSQPIVVFSLSPCANLQQFHKGICGITIKKGTSTLFLRFFGATKNSSGSHVFLSLFPLSRCNQTEEILNFSPISLHALSPQPNTVLVISIRNTIFFFNPTPFLFHSLFIFSSQWISFLKKVVISKLEEKKILKA